MGMTIEESKKRLAIEKGLAIKTGLNHDANGTLADAIDVAIDTMRKYQKIVGIVSLNDEEFKQCGLKELKEILEVIADGND